MKSISRTVSPGTLGVLAFNLARSLITALNKKGLLTDAEAANIIRQSGEDIADHQRQPALDFLKTVWPDIRL